MNKIIRDFGALWVVFLMVASAILVIPASIGATSSRAEYMEDAANNNCIRIGSTTFGGTPYQIQPGDTIHGSVNTTANEGGFPDFIDCYVVSASAGDILIADAGIDNFNWADPGRVNINIQVQWPNGNTWASSYNDRAHETATGFTAIAGWYFIIIAANFTVEGGSLYVRTTPCDYTLNVTVKQPDTLTIGDHPLAFNATGSLVHYWFKLSATAATMVRLVNPVGGDVDMDMYGIWHRGLDSSAGDQSYQPFYINRSYVKSIAGNTESAGARAGDMDIYIHLWAREGAGTMTVKAQDFETSLPSDGNNKPDQATVVTKTTSFLAHADQSWDHFDWYKFQIKSGEKYTLSLNLQNDKYHYYNMSLWDADLNYLGGWFNTVNETPFIPRDTGTGNNGNPISTAGILKENQVATYTGYYYVLVMPIRSMDSQGNALDDTPSSQDYRLLVQLPDYGPNKIKDIGDRTIDEDHNITGIDLKEYFTDPEAEALSYKVTKKTVGSKVTATIDASDIMTLQPDPNWFGTCDFMVEGTDGDANVNANTVSSNFTLTVNPVNDNPFLVGRFTNFSMWEGDSYEPPLKLPELYGDIDDGNLSYTYTGNNLVKVTVQPLSKIVNFTTEDGLTFGSEKSIFENITFTGKDDTPGSTPASFVLNVEINHKNHKPVADRDKVEISMDEGAVYKDKLNVNELFTDSDIPTANDELTYEVLGIHELSKVDVEIDPVSTELKITPRDPDFAGEDAFDIEASDSYGSKALVSFHVTIKQVNDPPIITKWTPENDTVEISEGYDDEFSIPADGIIDPDTPQNEMTFTWYVDGVDQSKSPYGGRNTLTFKTAYATDEEDSYRFPAGTYNLKVEVTDGTGKASVEWTVVVLDVNQKPNEGSVAIVKPKPGDAFEKGQVIVLEASTATDVDGDTLTYEWWDQTTNTKLGTGQSVQVSNLASGEHSIVCIVSDGQDGHNVTSSYVSVTVKGGGGGNDNRRTPGFEAIVLTVAIVAAAVIVLGRRKEE